MGGGKVYIEFGANHDFSDLAASHKLKIKRFGPLSERFQTEQINPQLVTDHDALMFWLRARFDKRIQSDRRMDAVEEQSKIVNKLMRENKKISPAIIPYLLTRELRLRVLPSLDLAQICPADCLMNEDQLMGVLKSPTPLAPQGDIGEQELLSAYKQKLILKNQVNEMFAAVD